MKPFLLFLALLATSFAQEERILIVPEKTEKPAPLFFSAAANISATASLTETTSTQQITYTVIQGIPETLSLPLSGPGKITAVTGDGLRDWSVRVAGDGSRFLDVRPVIADPKNPPKSLSVTVRTEHPATGDSALLLPSPGNATGFSLAITLAPVDGTELRVTNANGLSPLESGVTRSFLANGVASLEFSVSPSGSGASGLELLDASLKGKPSEDAGSVTFTLTATARAKKAGASAELLSGGALSGNVSTDSYHIALNEENDYEIIADAAGDFPIAIEFVVPVVRKGDWYALDFALPAGVVVPVSLEGLPAGVSFDRDAAIVPQAQGAAWRGFLPADGSASLAWKKAGDVADGSLFYSSTATTKSASAAV